MPPAGAVIWLHGLGGFDYLRPIANDEAALAGVVAGVIHFSARRPRRVMINNGYDARLVRHRGFCPEREEMIPVSAKLKVAD